MSRTIPFDLNGIRVFGNDDLDDGIVLINDMSFNIITDIDQLNTNIEETNEKTFKLNQNFPNPFNALTKIDYYLYKEEKIKLSIYNIEGKKIKVLKSEKQQPGYGSIFWDATNKFGQPVPTGIYFLKMNVSEIMQTKKMILLK